MMLARSTKGRGRSLARFSGLASAFAQSRLAAYCFFVLMAILSVVIIVMAMTSFPEMNIGTANMLFECFSSSSRNSSVEESSGGHVQSLVTSNGSWSGPDFEQYIWTMCSGSPYEGTQYRSLNLNTSLVVLATAVVSQMGDSFLKTQNAGRLQFVRFIVMVEDDTIWARPWTDFWGSPTWQNGMVSPHWQRHLENLQCIMGNSMGEAKATVVADARTTSLSIYCPLLGGILDGSGAQTLDVQLVVNPSLDSPLKLCTQGVPTSGGLLSACVRGPSGSYYKRTAEWLAYHYQLGMSKAYLYVSPNFDASPLAKFQEVGFLEIVSFPRVSGVSFPPNTTHDKGFDDNLRYTHCLHHATTEWTLVANLDEYLVIPRGESLAEALGSSFNLGGVSEIQIPRMQFVPATKKFDLDLVQRYEAIERPDKAIVRPRRVRVMGVHSQVDREADCVLGCAIRYADSSWLRVNHYSKYEKSDCTDSKCAMENDFIAHSMLDTVKQVLSEFNVTSLFM